MWVAAKVAAQEGVAEPTAVLGAVADPDVFASGATTAAGQLSAATLREAVLTAVGRDRLGQAALTGRCDGRAAAVRRAQRGWPAHRAGAGTKR